MSKRTNNHQYNSSNAQSHKKQTRMPKVEKRKSKDTDHGLEVRQFRSIQNYQNTSQNVQSDQLSIDRLDLIFQKEPKDIQQKLINLLISYNAVMHYNNETDMFQVDLLLPFLDEDQKREFIRQFLQIRRMKNLANRQNIYDIKSSEWINQQDQQLLKGQEEIRKFSFNAYQNSHVNDNQHQIDQKDQQDFVQNNNVRASQLEKKAVSEQPMNKTGQFNEVLPVTVSKKQKAINYSDLDEVIARRLKNAIDAIAKRKVQQYETNITQQHKDEQGRAILVNEEVSKEQQSIIDQISNPQSFNNTQAYSDRQQSGAKQLSASEYIKDDYINQPTPQHQRQRDVPYIRKAEEFNYYSEHAPYIQIAEEPEETQYQPLFKQQKTQQGKNSGKNISFQAFTKKYTSIKEQKSMRNKNNQNQFAKKGNQTRPLQTKQKSEVFKVKNYQSAKNQQKAFQNKSYMPKERRTTINISIEDNQNRSQLNRERMTSKDSSHSNNRSKNRNVSPISAQSKRFSRHLDGFFQTHKKNLDTLYTQIRQKIHQKVANSSPSRNFDSGRSPQKSLEDLYILVEDDLEPLEEGLSSIAEETDSSQFREEMIKQYHHQILVNNRNLSSEDLIRFFKYLHTNAKKLYIKYIKNKNK